jgi:hypothetical protein
LAKFLSTGRWRAGCNETLGDNPSLQVIVPVDPATSSFSRFDPVLGIVCNIVLEGRLPGYRQQKMSTIRMRLEFCNNGTR